MSKALVLSALLASVCLSACNRAAEPAAPSEPTRAEAAIDEAKQAVADKARELADRKATELMLEQQANADGSKLDVTIGDDGSMRTEGVDKDGKPVYVEVGIQQLAAGELKLPVFSGATPQKEGAKRFRKDDQMVVIAAFHSTAPLTQLSAFYRAELAKLPGVIDVLAPPEGMEGQAALTARLQAKDSYVSVMLNGATQADQPHELVITQSLPIKP